MHYPRQGGGPRVDMLMLRCLMGQPYVTRLLPLHRSQSTPWSMRDSFHIFFCSLNFATQSTWSGISISWILWRSSVETLDQGLVNSGKVTLQMKLPANYIGFHWVDSNKEAFFLIIALELSALRDLPWHWLGVLTKRQKKGHCSCPLVSNICYILLFC